MPFLLKNDRFDGQIKTLSLPQWALCAARTGLWSRPCGNDPFRGVTAAQLARACLRARI